VQIKPPTGGKILQPKQQWTDLGLLNRLLQEDYKKCPASAIIMAMHSERKRLTAIDYTDSVTWTTKKRKKDLKKAFCISNKMAMG